MGIEEDLKHGTYDPPSPRPVMVHDYALSGPCPLEAGPSACQQLEAQGHEVLAVMPIGGMPNPQALIQNPNMRVVPALWIISRSKNMAAYNPPPSATDNGKTIPFPKRG